jgi:hypothetical protein
MVYLASAAGPMVMCPTDPRSYNTILIFAISIVTHEDANNMSRVIFLLIAILPLHGESRLIFVNAWRWQPTRTAQANLFGRWLQNAYKYYCVSVCTICTVLDDNWSRLIVCLLVCLCMMQKPSTESNRQERGASLLR